MTVPETTPRSTSATVEVVRSVEDEQRELNEVLTPYDFTELTVDGIDGPRTQQARGAAALLVEFRSGRRRRASRWVVVDKACQAMVAGDPDGTVRFVLPVTTGRPGYETRLSDRATAFRYEPAADNGGWRNSSTFPVGDEVGGNMYRPIYFDRGIAIHGSREVPPHPNSYGCVGVDPAHQDQLVAWLGLDELVAPTWVAERIGLVVTVRGELPTGAPAADAPSADAASGDAASGDAMHLPDEGQRLLVRTVLVGGVQGRAAFDAWRSTIGASDGFDWASERMLPLVYATLLRDEALDGDEADARVRELLAGHYRRSWYKHNRLLHRAKPAIRLLQDAGFEVMVTKGVSLAARYYDDRGARSIGDVDVVVREDDAASALELLSAAGWYGDDPEIPAEQLLPRSHAVGLLDGKGGYLDLHRRMIALSRPGLDGPVWTRAQPAELDNLTVLMPCPADELLLAVLHGWAWSAVSSIRWIPDVAAILPSMDDAAWTTLIDEARRRQVSYRVSIALRTVRDDFGVAVPSWVLDDLAAGPFASFEESEERWHTRGHRRVPPGVFAYYEYVRLVGTPDGVGWWIGYAKYYASLVSRPDGRNPLVWMVEKTKRRLARKAVR